MSHLKLAIWIKQNTFLGKNSTYNEYDLERLLQKDEEMFEYFLSLYIEGQDGLRKTVSRVSGKNP